LKIVKEEELKDLSKENWKINLQGILQGEVKWKTSWMRATYCLMSCGKRRWVPLIRVTGYVSYAFTLVVTKLGDNMCQG
jgi:hypothetical protein